jgi:hypothetical protein
VGDDFDEGERDDWGESAEDTYATDARDELLKLINDRSQEVFYERQLQVFFENRFYHWVTSKALNELAEDGEIQSGFRPLTSHGGGAAKARFFFSTQLRYWTRKANEAVRLISAYSDPVFTRAIGRQAEMLFDAGLARAGFIPQAQETREYNGKRWEESDHDLDRIYVRDGLSYGAEIKNKLAYIEAAELYTKLRMNRHLGLIPLFIARMMPKSWINEVWKAGGFCLIFKFQLYPFGQEVFAREVSQKLELPVDCPRALADGTIQRFLKWHLKRVANV